MFLLFDFSWLGMKDFGSDKSLLKCVESYICGIFFREKLCGKW